jgi:beta-mannosidase
MNPDVNRRIRHEVYDECRSRFVSEYGVIGPCHPDSVKQYLLPGQVRVGSRAWKIHTNTFEKDTTPAAIRYHYADPDGLGIPDYILYGQMFQATMYGRSIEALRFRKLDPKDDCQGAVIWMYTDCWGETGWTLVDYYLRRKASYYWFRRACAPVKAIVRRRGRSLVTRVVNDTLADCSVQVRRGWMRLDGTDARLKGRRVRVPANGMVEIGREAVPGKRDLDPREWLYAARLEGHGVEDAPSIWLLAPHRELAVPESRVAVKTTGNTVTLVSDVYCHGVHVNDHGREVVSDNYFDLLPGIPKVIRRVDGKSAGALRFRSVEARG